MSAYPIIDGMIQSAKSNYKGTISSNAVVSMGQETVVSFGCLHMSVSRQSSLTINTYATNDMTTSPTWFLINSYSPTATQSVNSIALSYRAVRIDLVNGPSNNDVSIYTQFSTEHDAVNSGTLDTSVTASTTLDLTRSFIAGRGKLLDSTSLNATVSAGSSLRVIDGAAPHSYRDSVNEIARLSIDTRDIPTNLAPSGGVVTIVDGASVSVTGSASGVSRAVQYVAPVVDNNTVTVFRGATNFTVGSNASDYSRHIFGHVGFGTYGTDFGVWYNANGIIPAARMTVSTAASTNTNVTITLNSIPYVCTVSGLNPSYPVSSAYDIVTSFNALKAPWVAIQQGRIIMFYGLTYMTTTTMSVSHTDPTLSVGVTSAPVGVEGTWTFTPRSSFNIDKMTEWTSGDLVEHEITVVANNIRLAVIDKNTKEMKDVHVVTTSSPLFIFPEYHMMFEANGPASLVVYSASIGALRGTEPKKPLRNSVVTSSSTYAYTGSTFYPIAMIAKRGTDMRSVVIRKIIFDCAVPTRLSVVLASNATISSSMSSITITGAPKYYVYNIPYNASNVPSSFGYSGTDIIYADNFMTTKEIVLDMPLDVYRTLTLAVCTNNYPATNITYWIIFDEY